MLTYYERASSFAAKYRWRIIYSIGIASILFIIWQSNSFQSCVQANYYDHAAHNFAERLRILVGIRWWCTGIFIDQNGVAITAAATIAVAWFTFSLRDATWEQGKLTQESINIATREFEATHRAWISYKEHFISDPIAYDAVNNIFVIRVTVLVKNTGSTPALYCRTVVRAEEITMVADPGSVLTTLAADEKFRLESAGEPTFGFTVFPKGDFRQEIGAVISTTQLDQLAAARGVADVPLHPILFMCTSYFSPIDKKVHQTMLALLMQTSFDNQITRINSPVPIDRLRLVAWPQGSMAT